MSPSRPTPLNLAFLGCGAVTARHARTVNGLRQNVRLHFASRDPAKAETTRRRFAGAGAFGSYAAAMDDPSVEVVMVATPPNLHLDQTLAALSAGKHVIVEKPAFPAGDDFLRVREAAAAAGRQVLVAENYAYKPVVRVLRRALADGLIGDPLLVHLDAVKRQDPQGWRADPTQAGGGGLLEGGIHWVSFMTSLGLPVVDVAGHDAGGAPGRGTATEETVLAVFEYQGGAVGTLSFSWEVPTRLYGIRLSRIYGREGTIRFESNGLFVFVHGRRTRFHLPDLRDRGGFRAMFTDFFDAIRTGRQPEMTLDRAEQDIRLVNRIYASMGARP